MKTKKFLSIAAGALLFTSAFHVKASSPFIDILIMEIPTKSIVQVSAADAVDAFVYITDQEGTVMFHDVINSESISTRVFDFSNLQDGTYTIYSESDFVDITKTIELKDSKIESVNKETEYKPIFKVEDNILKVNFLNQKMNDIEFSLENPTNIFHEEKNEGNFSYQKQIDVSNLMRGEYFAKLDTGVRTFYHFFEVK